MSKKKSEYKIVAERRGSGNPIIKSKFFIAGVSAAALGTAALVTGIALMCVPKGTREVVTFKVTFDANDESASIKGSSVVGLAKATLLKNINAPEVTPPDGKKLVGWSYDKDGKTVIAENEEIREAKTLYAVYKTIGTSITVTFTTGGLEGVTLTGPTSLTGESGEPFGAYNKPKAEKERGEKISYQFSHWADQDNKEIKNSEVLTSDITLHPVFKEIGEEFAKLTFAPMPEDVNAGYNVTLNDKVNTPLTINLSTILPFSECNKPTATKMKDLGGGYVFSFEFKNKWMTFDGKDYHELKNWETTTFKTDTTLYAQFETEPTSLRSEYYCTDPDDSTKGYGVIKNGSESIGDNIEVEFQNGKKETIERTKFNYDVYIGSKITSISPNFLWGCTSFNKTITVPDSVTFIGNNFLLDCTSFDNGGQELKIPKSVRTIADSFLYQCKTFNQKIVFEVDSTTKKSDLEKIGDNFMFQCNTYNKGFALPEGLKQIGEYFFCECVGYSTASITFPKTLESIGISFMKDSTNVSTNIDLSNCANLTSIPSGFLFNATNFGGQVTLPTSITSIGTNFLSWCTGGTFACDVSNLPNLKSIGGYFMYNNSHINFAVNLTKSVLLTTIGENFLAHQTARTTAITLPDSITSIGGSFLYGCTKFNQAISFGKNITTVGPYFMYLCNSSTATITINFDATWEKAEDDEGNLYTYSFRKSSGYGLSQFKIKYTGSKTIEEFKSMFESASQSWMNVTKS